MVSHTIDNSIFISWNVLTNGGMPILYYIVDWIVPGASKYSQAPNGHIDDESTTNLQISFSDVFAGQQYKYRILASNTFGRNSSYIFINISSPKGTWFTCVQVLWGIKIQLQYHVQYHAL